MKTCGCGRSFTDRGFMKHFNVCQRLQTLDELLAYGAVVQGGTEDCWMWARDASKYGKTPNGRAHRVAYRLAFGVDPDDQLVRHTCDRPGCVNPGHLVLGTHSDNTRDAVERSRHYTPFGDTDKRPTPPTGNDHYTRRDPDLGWRQVEYMFLAKLLSGQLGSKARAKWSYLLDKENPEAPEIVSIACAESRPNG